MRNLSMLIFFLLLAFSAAGLGALFQPGDWYAELAKPSWNPPSWVFGPVWTALYLMIAIAGWLVWRKRGFGGARLAFAAYGTQLVLNALWSWFFFGLHRPALAFVDIVLLWLAILATILLFRREHQLAGWLLVPYLAWVSFAAVLNATLWQMNA